MGISAKDTTYLCDSGWATPHVVATGNRVGTIGGVSGSS